MSADQNRIKQREQDILGKPMRLAPVTEVSDDLKSIVTPPSGYEKKAGREPVMLKILAHNPPMLREMVDIMSFFLVRGSLPVRDRELAVLRMAWMRQIPFIWGEHVAVGKRIGMTTEEIERITQGSSAPGWSEHERAVVKATEELVENALVSDETWATLSKTYDAKFLVELLGLVGQYQALGYIQNSLRMPLFEGNPGLSAR
jgi:alkylhydroperoxidase family enzyme